MVDITAKYVPNLRQQANVLGIGVDALTMRTALDAIAAAVLSRQKGYVCVAGVHGIMEARRDSSLARVFRNAFLVVPDGVPTVWMGRSQGLSMTRVFGPDLMLAVMQDRRLAGARHYLYGGAAGVAQQLKRALLQNCPELRIAGTYCPPFRSLSITEQRELLDDVKRLQPDMIWVGLSTPKQERFMAEYLPRLSTTLMLGVGAAFDYHTGRIKDSPNWVKRMGLQWMHRLMQDPLRLWRRYLFNNPPFAYNSVLQLLGVKQYTLDAVDERLLPSRAASSAEFTLR
jgi:N-acetylglucosaminyldiphosphoundecaprenol N-acetyl-beta-D-mannosaminyltransferase